MSSYTHADVNQLQYEEWKMSVGIIQIYNSSSSVNQSPH